MGYTTEEIRAARHLIRTIMSEEILHKKGGAQFTSLNGNDIEALFDLYDVTFFQGQIREKIIETNSSIKFFARSRTSGVAGLCGVKYIDENPLYYLDIAPNIVETLFKTRREGFPLAAGVGCMDRLGCVQLIMEHEIIHLLFLIWGYSSTSIQERGGLDIDQSSKQLKPSTSGSDTEQKVYAPHGLLFQCMIKEYFGHSRFDHDLGLTSISIVGTPPKGNVPRTFLKHRLARNISFIGSGFENWAASCYIDSILMVLFDSVSSFWRKGIMDVDVSTIDYTGRIQGSTTTSINTIDKMIKQARKIQNQIKEDYASTHVEKRVIKCTVLRQLLAEVLPSMKPRGNWVLFNTGQTYDVIANVFPDLMMDIPFQIHRWVHPRKDGETKESNNRPGRYISDSVDYVREASLTMWDYLDPLTDFEDEHDYKEIRWDLIDSPVLVFYNGGTPRIRNFGVSGREKGYIYIQGDKTGIIKKHSFDIHKRCSFGMTIIDGRYRLIGVITLEGVSPQNEGGSHYTAHFMGTDENWYYYNDIGAQVIKVDSLPEEGVWIEKGSSMPSMYFYQKIKNPKTDRPVSRRDAKVKDSEPHFNYNTPEIYKGIHLDYKKIRSDSDPYDIVYMYFVYDKTDGNQLSYAFNKLGLFTNVNPGVRMWKINNDDQGAFETKIKEIDMSYKPPGSNRVKSGIDLRPSALAEVGVGKVYKTVTIDRSQIHIVNYSDNTFAIISPTPLSNLEDGMLIRNIKYGFNGYGYIYPKSKIDEIEKRLK